jgi:hypothetical protein
MMIRGSSLPRVAVCNGSTTFSHIQDEESDVAKEGTAFHEYLESRFKGENPLEGASAKNGVVFDSDMNHFANRILPLIPAHAIPEVEVAYKIYSTDIVGHVDYHWEEDDGKTLVVMDIKYGYRAVEAEKNWQLLGYMLGIIIQKQKKYEKIVLRIIQPRAAHYLGWIRDAVLTNDQAEEAYHSLAGMIKEIEEGKIKYQTSDKCRYCPALKEACPVANEALMNAIDVTLNGKVEDSKISDDDLAFMLNTYDRVKDIFKIKIDALNDLARMRIKSGSNIKGYGLEPAYGNRKWSKDLSAEAIKMMTGFDIEKKVLMSPADAEKAKVDQSLIDSLTTREQKGFSLIKMDSQKQAEKIFGTKGN